MKSDGKSGKIYIHVQWKVIGKSGKMYIHVQWKVTVKVGKFIYMYNEKW